MPPNVADYGAEETKGSETGSRMTPEVQRNFADARARIEQAVQDGLEQLRAQSRAYADAAGQQFEQAQQYVTERVRERPLAATGVALGVGVLIGLLVSAGRR